MARPGGEKSDEWSATDAPLGLPTREGGRGGA
jgi:hypothetical protein